MADNNEHRHWHENSRIKRLGFQAGWTLVAFIVLGFVLVAGQNMNRVESAERRLDKIDLVLAKVIEQNATTKENQRWAEKAFRELARKIDRISTVYTAPPKPWEKYRGTDR